MRDIYVSNPLLKAQIKGLIDDIYLGVLKDLEEYQYSIGCTYCDCEKKMWKLQEKYEKLIS